MNSTVVHLPGTNLTPEVVLHRTLGKVGRIKAISVVIMWDDDTFAVDRSLMKVAELCMAGRVLDMEIADELRDRKE